ncbi:MAG: hypothetical protein ACOC43_09795, partial [Desulfohalobiaceae bacterium]
RSTRWYLSSLTICPPGCGEGFGLIYTNAQAKGERRSPLQFKTYAWALYGRNHQGRQRLRLRFALPLAIVVVVDTNELIRAKKKRALRPVFTFL